MHTPLPKAKNLRFYCLYGAGKQTEAGYFYRPNINGKVNGFVNGNDVEDVPFVLDSTVNSLPTTEQRGGDVQEDVQVEEEFDGTETRYGVVYGDGDGTGLIRFNTKTH